MKIALAQLNYHIGNFEENVRKIKESIKSAKEGGADIVVFAELAVSGYPPRDFLEFNDFIERCHHAVVEIATECTGIAAVVGCPVVKSRPEREKPVQCCIVPGGWSHSVQLLQSPAAQL